MRQVPTPLNSRHVPLPVECGQGTQARPTLSEADLDLYTLDALCRSSHARRR